MNWSYFPHAEDVYKSIVTDSATLQAEVAIMLFTLYVQKDKLDSAVNMIKKAVSINPDYHERNAVWRRCSLKRIRIGIML